MHPCKSIGCKNIKGQSWRSIKNLPVQPALGRIEFELAELAIFYATSNFDLKFFLQPLDLQECTVPHLKDLIHICLGPEAQGCGMTFKRFYVGSKYPFFISYRGKLVYLFCYGCNPLCNL